MSSRSSAPSRRIRERANRPLRSGAEWLRARALKGWFLKRLHNPTLALVAMSLTVLVPAGLVLWLTGAMLIEQLSAFITAAPTIVTRASEWFKAQHPGLHAGLVKLGVPDSALLFFTDPRSSRTISSPSSARSTAERR